MKEIRMNNAHTDESRVQASAESHDIGIDVHTHFVPENFPDCPSASVAAQWPSTVPAAQCCHRHVMISDKIYRTVSDQCWSASRRISDMAQMRIGRQVLSPMPELLSYWLPLEAAQVLLRDMNEQLARLVAEHPQSFTGLGAVPLQDVNAAIAELRHCHQLGLAGVELGSNVNGRAIGAPEFHPFFEAAQDLSMAVFVHAVRPAGMERLVGPGQLEQAVAFPGEIGLAGASVITSNLMLQFPRLKIALSHGGGSLGLLLPRLEHAWKSFPALQKSVHESPSAQARRLFYDALVYDASALCYLVERFGAEQLMLGTDYPFAIQEPDPVGRLAEAGFDARVSELMLRANAARFLGIG
jgi:aminocarboxymuconate-semialdehyde decarboxylase